MSLDKLEAAVREAFQDLNKSPIQCMWQTTYDDDGKFYCCAVSSVVGRIEAPTTAKMDEALLGLGIELTLKELNDFVGGWDGLSITPATPAYNLGAKLWKEIYESRTQMCKEEVFNWII